jgi:hypothetical protein
MMVAATALLCGTSPVDASRGYYTEQRIQFARDNIANYEWARKMRDETIAQADKWASYSDERLRTLPIPPQVPRGYSVHDDGCPIHGEAARGYHWGMDFDRPFKVKCPVGGEEYPSNDFAAYLASGMNDRSLLTGDYADDGWGWHKPGDTKSADYWFVAFYAHHSVGKLMLDATSNLSIASLLTEDPAKARLYAHKCAVILWQLAQYYPDYDYAKQSREGKEHSPDYQGKIINRIWETGVVDSFALAYDAVRPFIADDQKLADATGKSPAECDADIRDRLLHEAAKTIMGTTRQIVGNYGMHQRALLMVALAMDEKQKHPTSEEMIQHVVDNQSPATIRNLGMKDAVLNLVYRDGLPPESFSYNNEWTRELTAVADILRDCGVNFYQDPRFLRMLTWPFGILTAGVTSPAIGDCGGIFGNYGNWSPELCYAALQGMPVPDQRFAWALKNHHGNMSIANPLFYPSKESVLKPFEGKPDPVVGFDSTLFPGYGVAILQCGSDANPSALSFSYSAHPNHNHWDQLNIQVFSHGNFLLTDLGYPDQLDGNAYRTIAYHSNTIAHNTVTVDAAMQGRQQGVLHAFQKNGFAQVVDASCEGAYLDKVSLYRRADILVQVTPDKSYVFDAFYVRGGKQHDYAIHGTQADLTCQPPLGPAQTQGTLAGVDVPNEQFYDDADLKVKMDNGDTAISYTSYRGSGFQFLKNVQRAPLAGSAVCEWSLTEPLKGQANRQWRDISLRAHFLGGHEELIACDGPLQRDKSLPESLKCVIRRRIGDDLKSCFTSVFEPYKGKPWIKSVSAVNITPRDGNAAAARIEMADGTSHYAFHSISPDRTYVLDGKVTVCGQAACLVLDAKGKPVKSMLLNGRILKYGGYVVKGKGIRRSTITSVDYSNGVIELADPVLTSDLGPDNVVLVRHKGFADCVTPRKVLDKKRFSIGDEDLRVAGGPVTELKPDEITTSARNRFALPGHTITNGSYEPLGRLTAKRPAGWMVQGYKPLTWDSFKTAPGDAGPRYIVVMAARGDEVLIPDCVVRD